MLFNIANTVLAVCLFLFSAYVFCKNKLYSKTNVEIALFSAIQEALLAAEESMETILVFKDDHTKYGRDVRHNARQSFDNVLLAYDHACAKYYEQAIDTEYFKITYTPYIAELFNSAEYKPFLSINGKYPSLHKFYTEHCRNSHTET